MVSYAALTERNAVDDAIAEFDRLGRDAFLEKYGFGEAKEYFLVTERGRYDSKAIFGAAYERQHGTRLGPSDFNGGKNGAAGRLAQLGYTVEGLESAAGRLSFAVFADAMAEFKPPIANAHAIHAFMADKDFQEFYIPASRPYIAMISRGGNRPSAWIHRGFITHRKEDGTWDEIALPENRLRDGGGMRQRRREESDSRTCSTPGCGMVLPPSGVCDNC
ncbi:hypothetical protein OH146_11160 [Salinibacterium sp. SYSU T00001]|uniref:hypothetical protein n=1 Tax=Homoserinimonas sedimenticola TaxID=2986805 RepID=UPI002236521B|nr:hypothetical protein [Salinibacterium sedimenticola]MCW4386331.1 hypothetical protein [Salinibacterium sedimenticola]